MKKSVLRAYANLIVRSGVNVRPGQEVMIYAELDQPEFVQMVVEEAYRAKAKKVIVEWNYAPLKKVHTRYQSLETLGTVEQWEQSRQQHFCDVLPARIHLISEDPDGLKGVDTAKMAKARQMSYPILKSYLDQRRSRDQWCIAAVPGIAWAKKVFPGLNKNQAVEKLWEAILYTSRVTEDPIQAWDEHNANLKKHCAYLNGLNLDSLHYTAENGTDLTVGLAAEGLFMGGADLSLEGVLYNANIPTEECFASPDRRRTQGIVYSTKPLSYQGQLIENFSVRFEQGKAVEVHAERGEEVLKTMISMDEGAAYLGECALVPQKSPIAQSGLLFYQTLFDENASCHLALGNAYEDTIRDYEHKTREDLDALGLNESMIHVDFMVGCDSMNIDGLTKDGKTVPIFRNGNWAF